MGRPGQKGKGQISIETGALERFPYGFAGRFEGERRGRNPEKILAAAHATCSAMAFPFGCDKAGLTAGMVDAQPLISFGFEKLEEAVQAVQAALKMA